MSLSLGLPTTGSDVTVVIHRVHLHPLNVLVELWAKFGSERAEEYKCLAEDIQSSGRIFQEFEGCPGDQCLVHVDGIWNRARIVSRNGSKYSVFLIDKGSTSSTTTCQLAWGKRQHFQLPPEVEFCVLANVLPLSTNNQWSPVSFEFLRSLSGQSLKAHVQDVLFHQRIIILHIPSISKQMYEMHFAKQLSPDMFKEFVLMSLKSNGDIEVSPKTQQISTEARVQLHTENLFMVPELQAGVVENVIVTEVSNPTRIYCQLKVFSHEIMKLSQTITECTEGRLTNFTVNPDMVNSPCAAKGLDGRWQRSILQQVFPTNGVVEVFNIDYGTRQFVQVENVKPLASEFFRMPVVTYTCSLHGVIDKGIGWTSSQIDRLRKLLLHKTMIAKFEYHSMSEGVYYVTLFDSENTNVNKLFGSEECEKTEATCNLASSHDYQEMLTSTEPTIEQKGNGSSEKIPAEDLSRRSSHLAVVQHVTNPSEFWIQTQNYATELDELMNGLCLLYKNSENKDVVKQLSVGLYCAAKAKDCNFYRATVTAIGVSHVKVYLVDYGNTEVVNRCDIRTLPDEFKKVPRLALRCTLANVRPKDGTWSPNATGFFTRAVKDKLSVVHVTAKDADGYAVLLSNPNNPEEQDLSTHMWTINLAEKADSPRQPKANLNTQPGNGPTTQKPLDQPASACGNKVDSAQTKITFGHAINRRVPTFKENVFPTGSCVEVSVSCIKSPNDFWCQLVRTAGHLKFLMHDMQTHYASTEYEPLEETACVARHPDNGMWYRAIIIHEDKTPRVEVLFVDYGQTEVISLYDVRSIRPEFRTLPGQAFRCSLLNPLDSSSVATQWKKEAVAIFQKFVETAASNFDILKCTIYAVMYSEEWILFNIVDLETPFESVCASMVNLVKSAPVKMDTGQSFHLKSYYYSTHNVKSGSEEKVIVTHVNSVNQFYCQLERNAAVMKDLQSKVNSLCQNMENVKLPQTFGTLCFAKYTDGQWYRGQIKTKKPAILIHFVDYGDIVAVDKSDILPVPREANDVMSVPVQALVCSLSDVPANVTKEANCWFETSATESTFQAVVVGKEPDGKFMVELYQGNTQINSKIKKMFQIELYPEKHVVYQKAGDGKPWPKPQQDVPEQPTKGDHDTETIRKSDFPAAKGAHQIRDEIKPAYMNQQSARKPLCQHVVYQKAGDRKSWPKPQQDVPEQPTKRDHDTETIRKSDFPAAKGARQIRDEIKPANMNQQSARKPLCHINENGHRVKAGPLKLYKPPQRRQSCGTTVGNMGNGPKTADTHVLPNQKNVPADAHPLSLSQTSGTDSTKESKVEKLPKLADLPTKSITSGMEAEVCVSHYNSTLSFYIQLVSDENDIFSVVEKLNKLTPKMCSITDVTLGDLVQAEFADDCSWYRAVVKEIQSNASALVEFIDFGNTSVTPFSKMGRLPTSSLQDPRYSIHCMLSKDTDYGKEDIHDPKVLSALKEAASSDGEKKLKCRFIRQLGCVQVVSLEDSGMNVLFKVPASTSADAAHITQEKQVEEPGLTSEKPSLNPSPPHYSHKEFFEKQKMQSYISTINNADTFWCQSTDADELDKITSVLSEVGKAVHPKPIDADALSPGSPCIAIFSDDHLWYRAEVINKDGEKVSVLFVDYGNESQVSVTDVRQLPPDLEETPPQAFLCKLEGFDPSCGFWENGALENLSTLANDKLVELTVTRVTRDAANTQYCVQMECGGQKINEAMKTWWKSLTAENKVDTAEQCDLTHTVEETTLPDVPESLETVKDEEPHKAELVTLESKQISEGPEYQKMHEDVNSFNVADGVDSLIHFDQGNDGKDGKIILVRKDVFPSTTSAVRMVPREVVYPRGSTAQPGTIDLISDFEQIETELLLPSPLLPAPLSDAPVAHDIVAESEVKEVQSLDALTEVGLVTEDDPFVLHEDVFSDPPKAQDIVAESYVEEAQCLDTPAEIGLVTEDDPFVLNEDVYSDPPKVQDIVAESDVEEAQCLDTPAEIGLALTEDEPFVLHEDVYSDAPIAQDIVSESEVKEVQSLETPTEVGLVTEDDPFVHNEDVYSEPPKAQDIVAERDVEEAQCLDTPAEVGLGTEDDPFVLHEDVYSDPPKVQDTVAESDVEEAQCLDTPTEIGLALTEDEPFVLHEDVYSDAPVAQDIVSESEVKEVQSLDTPTEVGLVTEDDPFVHNEDVYSDPPKAQDIVAERDVEEAQCLDTPAEIGLVTEDDPFVLNEDVYSDPPKVQDIVAESDVEEAQCLDTPAEIGLALTEDEPFVLHEDVYSDAPVAQDIVSESEVKEVQSLETPTEVGLVTEDDPFVHNEDVYSDPSKAQDIVAERDVEEAQCLDTPAEVGLGTEDDPFVLHEDVYSDPPKVQDTAAESDVETAQCLDTPAEIGLALTEDEPCVLHEDVYSDAPIAQDIVSESEVKEVQSLDTPTEVGLVTEDDPFVHNEDVYSDPSKAQDIVAERDVEEAQCLDTPAEIGLVTEDDPFVLNGDVYSDPPKVQDTVAESDVEEAQCLDTPAEIGLALTEDEPFVLHEDLYSALQDDSVSVNTKPKMDITFPVGMHSAILTVLEDCMKKDETADLHDDRPALSCDIKPESESQESNVEEELTGSFEGCSLTDITTDQQQRAEPEDGEQREDLPPGLIEGCEGSEPSEEASSADNDIKELQPCEAAHQSLIITDDSADVLPVEPQLNQ